MKQMPCVLFFFLYVLASALSAQEIVVASRQRIKMKTAIDDVIRYKKKGSNRSHTDRITQLTKHALVTVSDTLFLAEVRGIGLVNGHVEQKRHAAGAKVLTAGVLLAIGDLINVTIVQNKEFEMNAGVAAVAGVLVGSGIILITSKPVIRINRRNRLVIARGNDGF